MDRNNSSDLGLEDFGRTSFFRGSLLAFFWTEISLLEIMWKEECLRRGREEFSCGLEHLRFKVSRRSFGDFRNVSSPDLFLCLFLALI